MCGLCEIIEEIKTGNNNKPGFICDDFVIVEQMDKTLLATIPEHQAGINDQTENDIIERAIVRLGENIDIKRYYGSHWHCEIRKGKDGISFI